MSPSTNRTATCPPSAHCSRTSPTSQWLFHTLHPLASPADAAAPSQRSNKTLTTALKLLLAKQILTHPVPLTASTTAGTARRSNDRGHIYTVGDACFHHESLSTSDSTCSPGAPRSPTSPTSLRLPHNTHTSLASCSLSNGRHSARKQQPRSHSHRQ